MKTYTINIGMNNNNFNSGAMLVILTDLMNLLDIQYVKYNTNRIGDYIGAEEPTFVMEFSAISDYEPYKLSSLCTKIFTQECVAWSSNDRESNELQYHYNFEGEQMEFDYKYFLWVE